MRNALMAAVVAVVAVSGSGCASIITGTTQQVPVESEPAGARVKMDDVAVGNTPLTLTVKRGVSHFLTLEMEGFETAKVHLGRKFNGMFLGNVLFGGIIGILIDMGSGAWMWVDPAAVKVALKPMEAP